MGYNLLINGVYWGYNPLNMNIFSNFLGHPSRWEDMTPNAGCHDVTHGRVPASDSQRFLLPIGGGVGYQFWRRFMLGAIAGVPLLGAIVCL